MGIPDAPPRRIATTVAVMYTDNGGWMVTLGVAGRVKLTFVATELQQVKQALNGIEWVTQATGEQMEHAEGQRRFLEGLARGLPEGMKFGNMEVFGPFQQKPRMPGEEDDDP